MKFKKETIMDVHECCACMWCGFPMYENEMVYVDDYGNTFCCTGCATNYQLSENNFTNLTTGKI